MKFQSPNDINQKRQFTSNDFFIAENPEDLENNSSVLTKISIPKISDVKLSKKQVQTGNIGVDFTNPIYEGSFNTISYSHDTALKLKNLIDSLLFLNDQMHFIIVNFAKPDKITKFGNENVTEIWPSSESKEDSLKTLQIVINLVNNHQKSNKKVFLIFNDSVDFFYRFFNFYHFFKNEVFSKGFFGIN